MKIIYEIGDIIEIADDIEAPHELGAETVELINKHSVHTGMWTVEEQSSGKRYQIHEEWFTNY